MSQFSDDITKFNGIYKLPVSAVPTLDVGIPILDRLLAFKHILGEELDEIDEIAAAVQDGKPTLEILTMLADLLGDIQVYCASEMAKFGLPLDAVLGIIMESNFSKLGADGQPIYDERGKVMKGPNYWKPEPKIKSQLEKVIADRLQDVYRKLENSGDRANQDYSSARHLEDSIGSGQYNDNAVPRALALIEKHSN